MSRILTLGGVCLIVLGTVLMAGPVFGFSSFVADRGVSVGTSDDPNGLLGVVDNSDVADANIKNSNGESQLYYLQDNSDTFSSATEISANVTAFDGSSTALQATVQAAEGGNDFVVVMTCGGSTLNTQGKPTIEISASGDGIRVELERTSTNFIEVNCRGNGGGNGNGNGNGGTEPANFRAENIDADGPTQRFRFDVATLKNKDIATIDLSDAQQNAGVDYTNAGATVVNGDARSFEFDNSTYEITYEDSGGTKGTVEIELTGFEITGDQDGTVYYTDDQSRSDSDTFSVPTVVSDGGDVTTNGDVVVEAGRTAGTVDAGGDVRTGENANVNGNILSNGDVIMEQGSTVNDIDADGTITIESYAHVNGEITTDSDIIVRDNVNLPTVNAAETVYIGCNVNVNGEINANEVIYNC